MSTKRGGCAVNAVRVQLCVVGGQDRNENGLISTEIYITAHVIRINNILSQNIPHVAEMDEISQCLTPSNFPSNIIYCVITLWEILGLEGGPSGLVKCVELLEDTMFGYVQDGSEGLKKRISTIEEKI